MYFFLVFNLISNKKPLINSQIKRVESRYLSVFLKFLIPIVFNFPNFIRLKTITLFTKCILKNYNRYGL